MSNIKFDMERFNLKQGKQHEWGRRKTHTKFWWESQEEGDH
jgi:hypothetical protein